MKQLLVVAAHPDDEVLGCGGTLARHAREGDAISVVIVATGLASRGAPGAGDLERLRQAARQANQALGVTKVTFGEFPDNAMDGVPRLEVVRFVENAVREVQPTVVYTHFPGDLNIDHRRTAEAVLTACRPQPGHCVEQILFFEVPSSTEWQVSSGGATFSPNWYTDISATLADKLAALRAYESEMRPWPHPRSYAAVEHLARWRGATVGMKAAEAFVLARQLNRDRE